MNRRTWTFTLIALAVALGLAALSPLASSSPDGLDRVSEDHAPANSGEPPQAVPAPMADYRLPGLGQGPLATSLAGLAGVLVVFAACLLLGRILRAKHTPAPEGPRGETPSPS